MLDRDETVQPLESPEAASQEQPSQGVENNESQQSQEEIWGGLKEWNPQQFGLDYKGQRVFPKDPLHLKNLAQMGYSYNTSMEEVNKMRKELEEQKREYETKYGKYAEFDERLQKDQNLYNQVYSLMNGQGQNPESQTVYNPQYDNKIQELEGTIRKLQESEEDRQLRNTLDNLQKKYPDHNWKQDPDGSGTFEHKLLRYALDNGFSEKHIEAAYKDMVFDDIRMRATQSGAAQVAQKVQTQHRSGILPGNSSVPPKTPKSINPREHSYEELGNMAKKSLGL